MAHRTRWGYLIGLGLLIVIVLAVSRSTATSGITPPEATSTAAPIMIPAPPKAAATVEPTVSFGDVAPLPPGLIHAVNVIPVSPYAHGDTAYLTIVTEPDALCSVRIVYANGVRASSQSLGGVHQADLAGDVQLQWHPETEALGDATVMATCRLGKQSMHKEIHFTVQAAPQ